MSLAARLTRLPLAHNPDRAAEAVARLHDIPPGVAPLLEGAAGSSPYIAGLMRKEAHWLSHALWEEPEDVVTDLVEAAKDLAPDALDTGLRQIKRRAALWVALADLGGVWSLATVTETWTDVAEAVLKAALFTHVRHEAKRGKLPGISEAEAAKDAGGMVALAMGKMGAGELNYSSDIDIICLFDDSRFEASDVMDARAAFIRATRRMTASLSETTAEGYVFRTDLRLRPDPSVTPVCISIAAAERYYEAEGRSWERSAYIKARPAAGDLKAGARFLKTLKPFVWRRHLDFSMVQDSMEMRQRIRTHKGLHDDTNFQLEGHDLKLGLGGIREIEFFAQTRQLVAGGRDPSLRSRRTVKALSSLARAGWISREVAGELATLYAAHREVEHRLQMIDDAQTHSLPRSPEAFDQLARLSGEADTAAYRARIWQNLKQVEARTGAFFAPTAQEAAPSPLSRQEAEITERWRSYPALRSTRGREIFDRLLPDLLARLRRAPRPEEALVNFDGFLRGLPAGVQLFSLFEANPPLVDLIVDISATAPRLSRYLSRHSGVLDAVLDGRFFSSWPGADGLAKELDHFLEARDYEEVLDIARRWQKDWHFRIGVHQLRGLTTIDEAASQYSDLAEAVLRVLWPAALREVARRHGPAPGKGGAVLGMGSLGAGRLSAASDLDIIVVYDAGGVEMSDGPRPLSARAWYAKATKTLITALSAPTAAGTLYEADLRLRPSGRQGPVATSVQSYESYQSQEAWTWEHLALTRARGLAGSPEVLEAVERIRQKVISEVSGADQVRLDVVKMRGRIAAAGRTGSTWAVKNGPGGVQDIELLGQSAALLAGSPARKTRAQLQAGVASGWITEAEGAALTDAYVRLGTVLGAGRLLTEGALAADAIGQGGREFLARVTATPVEDLASLLDRMRADAAAMVDRIMARPFSGE